MVSVMVKTGDGESSEVNIQRDEHHENTEQEHDQEQEQDWNGTRRHTLKTPKQRSDKERRVR